MDIDLIPYIDTTIKDIRALQATSPVMGETREFLKAATLPSGWFPLDGTTVVQRANHPGIALLFPLAIAPVITLVTNPETDTTKVIKWIGTAFSVSNGDVIDFNPDTVTLSKITVAPAEEVLCISASGTYPRLAVATDGTNYSFWSQASDGAAWVKYTPTTTYPKPSIASGLYYAATKPSSGSDIYFVSTPSQSNYYEVYCWNGSSISYITTFVGSWKEMFTSPVDFTVTSSRQPYVSRGPASSSAPVASQYFSKSAQNQGYTGFSDLKGFAFHPDVYAWRGFFGSDQYAVQHPYLFTLQDDADVSPDALVYGIRPYPPVYNGTFTAFGTALFRKDGYPCISTRNQGYRTLHIVGGVSCDADYNYRPAILASMGVHDWFVVDLRSALANDAFVDSGIMYSTTVGGNAAQGAMMFYDNGTNYGFFTIAITRSALETVTMPAIAASDPTNLTRAIFLGVPLSSTPPVDSAWQASSSGGGGSAE